MSSSLFYDKSQDRSRKAHLEIELGERDCKDYTTPVR